jgi:hypothetical protein
MEVRNMETKDIAQSNVLELWANNYPEVIRWLTKLQKKKPAAYHFYRFCEWAHKTPPELLALKEKDASISPPPNEVEKLLDDFCGRDMADFTNSEKYNTAIAVKSFFKWSYRALERASGVVSLEQVRPYNALSKEGLRRLWNRALNLRDRALIPFVTSTGIAKETLSNLLWGHLEENWEAKDLPCINIGSELLKGHGKGKYKGVRQVTFLTGEAKKELLNYRDWIQEKLGRKVTPQDHIWVETYRPYEPLSYESFGNLITVLSDNAGVPFSWHDGRRWLTTALEQIGISPNWARKIRGRKVKGEESPYSQPAIEQLREKFREAVPLLEFIAERPMVPKEAMERIAKLEEQLKEEKRAAGISYRGKRHIKPPEEENCENGEHCGEENFKQIAESELLEHLKVGWKITHNLANGQVIIQR